MTPRPQRDQVQDDERAAANPPAGVDGADSALAGQLSHERELDAVPTGLPTSDRHALETLHHWEPQVKPTGETAGES